jgi:hypothetical protein
MHDVPTLSALQRWSGVAFVALAFLSSAAVSLPLSTDPPARIEALYDTHRNAYVIAQVAGLIGVVMLGIFLRAMQKRAETSSRAVTVGGVLTAAAAVATNISVLVLCFATLSPDGISRAAQATDITDDLLFAAFGLLALAMAGTKLPHWLRGFAGLAALLCFVRAADAWLSIPGMAALAPIAVLAVLLIVAIRLLRGHQRTDAAAGSWTASSQSHAPVPGREPPPPRS